MKEIEVVLLETPPPPPQSTLASHQVVLTCLMEEFHCGLWSGLHFPSAVHLLEKMSPRQATLLLYPSNDNLIS